MEKEINLKYLFFELVKNWKKILLAGIVLAIVFGAVSYMNLKNADQTETYGATGKMYVETPVKVDMDSEGRIDKVDSKDMSDQYSSFLMSDVVLENVAKDPLLAGEQISIKSLRDQIYLRGRADGSIIEVTVVAKNQEISDLICEKVMEYGIAYFNENRYTAKIIQSANVLGIVSIEMKESTADPRDTIAIVKPADVTPSEGMVLAKQCVIGFILGIILFCIYVCVMFIIRGRIVYAEQIEEETSLNLTGSYPSDAVCERIYSEVIAANGDSKIFAMGSLRKLELMNNVIQQLAVVLNQADQKMIVVEFVSGANASMEIEHQKGYDSLTVSEHEILTETLLNDKLSLLQSRYDLILLQCNDLLTSPIDALLAYHADHSVLFVESNTVTAKQMNSVERELNNRGSKPEGAVFVQCK